MGLTNRGSRLPQWFDRVPFMRLITTGALEEEERDLPTHTTALARPLDSLLWYWVTRSPSTENHTLHWRGHKLVLGRYEGRYLLVSELKGGTAGAAHRALFVSRTRAYVWHSDTADWVWINHFEQHLFEHASVSGSCALCGCATKHAGDHLSCRRWLFG